MEIPVNPMTNEEMDRYVDSLKAKEAYERSLEVAINFHYDAVDDLEQKGLQNSEEYQVHLEALMSLLINDVYCEQFKREE